MLVPHGLSAYFSSSYAVHKVIKKLSSSYLLLPPSLLFFIREQVTSHTAL